MSYAQSVIDGIKAEIEHAEKMRLASESPYREAWDNYVFGLEAALKIVVAGKR